MPYNPSVYYKKNREKLIARQLDYYYAHQEAYSKYYQDNRERIYKRNERNKELNPLKTKCRRMVYSSKTTDNLHNRIYAEHEYITADFLMDMYEKQQGKCYYECCKNDMLLSFDNTARDKRLITIQRLDNSYAHIKSNVCLACFECNCIKHREYDEYQNNNTI